MLHFLVRLACVRHAASVDSEPGSNARLKPEICSRRNRSAIPQSGRHECLHFTERPYFVSTLGLEPEPFLTVAGRFVIGRWQEAYARRRGSATDSFNWHVQPICQRPIRFPPERRAFSPEQITHGCGPVCPRNLLKLQLSSYNCQPEGITRLPQLLHSCEDSTQGERNALLYARRKASSAGT